MIYLAVAALDDQALVAQLYRTRFLGQFF